ncbi:hypothetical protein [Paludibacterium denitrificans]|uniref:Lipoprotein n=1 Tax=Paludibacterium denitrificans TaxID=2675226 RepID=A0A844GFQ9_9NEIS|nr:hypothetical protein [Paludibacterium denitrificans]MTD34058.1 hypothetical protein [Paludibacterium denitrificans]
MFKGAVKQTILLAMVLAALTGCASTADGIRFGHGPAPTTETDVAKAKQQLIDNAKSSAAKAAIKGAISVQSGPGIIVVGTVGPLRTVDGEKRHAFYVSYNNDAQKFHPGKPNSLTEDNFVKTIAGWTSVEIFSIPGVVNQRL